MIKEIGKKCISSSEKFSFKFLETNKGLIKPALVAEGFRARVKFKWTLTQRPGFESLIGITLSIAQSQKWLVTIQIVGCWVTYVAYNSSSNQSGLTTQIRTCPRTTQV